MLHLIGLTAANFLVIAVFSYCDRSGPESKVDYRGDQVPIVNLMNDYIKRELGGTSNGKRWAFTLSNAGSHYFEDQSNLSLDSG